MHPKKTCLCWKIKNWKQLDIIGASLKTGYEKIEHNNMVAMLRYVMLRSESSIYYVMCYKAMPLPSSSRKDYDLFFKLFPLSFTFCPAFPSVRICDNGKIRIVPSYDSIAIIINCVSFFDVQYRYLGKYSWCLTCVMHALCMRRKQRSIPIRDIPRKLCVSRLLVLKEIVKWLEKLW